MRHKENLKTDDDPFPVFFFSSRKNNKKIYKKNEFSSLQMAKATAKKNKNKIKKSFHFYYSCFSS